NGARRSRKRSAQRSRAGSTSSSATPRRRLFVADSSASFAIEVEESGSEDAAAKLEQLKATLIADSAALRKMTADLRGLASAGGSLGNIGGLDQLKSQVNSSRGALGGLGDSFGKAGSDAAGLDLPLDGVGKKSGKAGTNFAAMGRSLGKLGGPL